MKDSFLSKYDTDIQIKSFIDIFFIYMGYIFFDYVSKHQHEEFSGKIAILQLLKNKINFVTQFQKKINLHKEFSGKNNNDKFNFHNDHYHNNHCD